MRELVNGLMVVVLIALSVGQLDTLNVFARKQAAKALRGWKAPPAFFPAGYEIMKHGSHGRWK